MGAGKLIIVIFFLVLIGIGVYLFLNPSILFKPQALKNNVIVYGIVKTGSWTSPYEISFTSKTTGQVTSATINKEGYYSIALLGNDTYNFIVYYNTIFGVSTNNNCMGAVVLNATESMANINKSC